MKASKPLGKLLALLAVCSLAVACLALCACGDGNSQTKQNPFEGCWKLSSVEQNGKTIDSDEVEKAYQKNGFMYLLAIDADGQGSFDAFNKKTHHEDITWESTGDNKLTIKFEDSVGLAEMSGDTLKLEEGGMVFYFTKVDQSEYDALLGNLGSKSASSSSDSSADGVNPEFKKQMDDYEAFFDEYVEFMKDYKANPTDTSLLSKASSIMSRYSTMMSDFNKIKNQSLSTADAAYYSEVSRRILEKLTEIE